MHASLNERGISSLCQPTDQDFPQRPMGTEAIHALAWSPIRKGSGYLRKDQGRNPDRSQAISSETTCTVEVFLPLLPTSTGLPERSDQHSTRPLACPERHWVRPLARGFRRMQLLPAGSNDCSLIVYRIHSNNYSARKSSRPLKLVVCPAPDHARGRLGTRLRTAGAITYGGPGGHSAAVAEAPPGGRSLRPPGGTSAADGAEAIPPVWRNLFPQLRLH